MRSVSRHSGASVLVLVVVSVALDAQWTPSSKDELIFDGNVSVSSCNLHYCLETNGTRVSSKCRCDADCWKRYDCCLNAWMIDDDAAGLDPKSIDDFVRDVRITCEPVGRKLYVMVSSCPSRSDPNRDLCETHSVGSIDPLSTVPVTSLETNVTYRNIYCSACNRDFDRVVFWKTELQCRNRLGSIRNVSDALEIYMESRGATTNCSLEVNPIGELPSEECLGTPNRNPLDPPMTTTCHPSFEASKRLRWFCRTFYAPIEFRGAVYRNVYCALCNGMDHNDTEEAVCWTPRSVFRSKCPPICFPLTGMRKSFTLLLDANFRSGGGVGTIERCPAGQIYDPFRKQCRLIVCGEHFEYDEGRCVRVRIAEQVGSRPPVLPLRPRDRNHRDDAESDCIRIEYDSSDVDVDSNGTLSVVTTGQRFREDRYERSGNGSSFRVCADLRQNYVDRFPGATFEHLTIVGSVLSIVSLFLKMTVFVVLPDSRTFPDRMIFCLSASLFVAHVLFATAVTSTSNYESCATVAVVLHYSFLASFAWMTNLAYDVFRTFASTEAIAPYVSTRRRFLRYSFFAWTGPLVVVLTAVLFDWGCIVAADSPFRPQYGRALCWISNRYALLVFFVAPVAIHVVVNTVLFYCTARCIWSSSRQTVVAQQQNSQSGKGLRSKSKSRAHHLRFSLYVKLALLMGLTWISGLVAIYGHWTFLWYVFVVLNTLQGLFIFVAFTPYRKVRRAWIRMRTPGDYYGPSHCSYNHMPLQRSSTKSSQLTRTSSSNASQRTFSMG